MNIQQEIQQALQYFQSGDLRQSKEICKRILKKQPDNWEVLYFLGLIYSRLGNHDLASQTLKQSITHYPNNPDAYHLIGMSFQAQGKNEEAIEYYRKTIHYNPNCAEAYNNIANLLKEKMQTEEAISYYQKAVCLKPDLGTAWYNLGVIFQERRDFDEAIKCYKKALLYDSSNHTIQCMLGFSLYAKWQSDCSGESLAEAEKIYRDILSRHTDDYVSCGNLGNVLKDLGQTDEAMQCYRKAIELKPDFIDAYYNLAIALKERGHIDESVSLYQKVIELSQTSTTFQMNSGDLSDENNKTGSIVTHSETVLGPDSTSLMVVSTSWTNLGSTYSDMGRMDEAERCYRRALAMNPQLAFVHSNLLLAMNYNPRYGMDALFSEHLHFAQQHAHGTNPEGAYRTERQMHRRLRIGYVSPDFLRHSVAYFVEPVLASHDRSQYEVFCYSDVAHKDEVTERMQKLSDAWRDTVHHSHEKVSEIIRNDRIDILVDLSGHTAGNRMLLFAGRPAPVQVTWIGYPATTGLSSMDYKVVDWFTDPPGMTEHFHTEKLVRMPETFLCYLPERDAPAVNELPALKHGYLTFGCFNNFAKVSDEILITWTKILRRLPNARLVMKARGLSSAAARSSLENLFRQQGIGSDRIELLALTPNVRDHLAHYHRVDIALDTFPYNGTTITCEALWMGVPVVTLGGRTYASRVGVSLLTNAGLKDLIAETPGEYVERAVKLASDLPRLSALRADLRHMVSQSPLTDAKRFTAHLEKAYGEMWTRYVLASGTDTGDKDENRKAGALQSRTLQTVLPIAINSSKIYRSDTDAMDGSLFLICAMFTPGEKYIRYANRLADSCEEYGLPYCIYEVANVHTSISLGGTDDLAYTKANFIAFNMEQFPRKNILYVDVDFIFMDYPKRISEISGEEADFAVYNWLSDRHNEAYMPVKYEDGGKEAVSKKYYAFSRNIGLYCTDQIICSGGVQLYRNSDQAKLILEYWQTIIARSPRSADDECLDYAYNNLVSTGIALKSVWLDKAYLRMPFWPHVKPVILHPGPTLAGQRRPIPALDNKKRFYPERCEQTHDKLIFPREYIIDVEEKMLVRVIDGSIVEQRPVQEEFWIYPDEE